MATAYAIKGPDGTIFQETASTDAASAWVRFAEKIVKVAASGVVDPVIGPALRDALIDQGFVAQQLNVTPV